MKSFTKTIYLTFCIILAISLLYSCEKEPSPINVNNVTLNKNEVAMKIGEKHLITANVSPTDADNKNVTWSSSNTNVATVTQSGLDAEITALSEGEATISVTTQDGQKTATCIVIVEKNVINVEDIAIQQQYLSIFVGDIVTINATISPLDADNKNVTWSSSNTNVATVTQSGLDAEITALSEGEATISVTTQDGQKTATCTITVEKKVINVEELILSQEEIIIGVGETANLSVTVLPEDATNKSTLWSSNNSEIATVNENGLVLGISSGEVVITVTAEDGGKTATCNVTVSSGLDADTQQLNDLEWEYW